MDMCQVGPSARIDCPAFSRRSSGIRRVHFDIDGDPVLDLTEGLDLKEEYRTVETTLIVG